MRISTLIMIMFFAASAMAKPVTKTDFAYGAEVVDASFGPVQTVLLPASVYRGVTQTDLGDLRVFNSNGEVVPHAIRQLALRDAATQTSERLPFFPLRGQPTTKLDELSMHIRRSDSGTIIDVNSTAGQATQAPLRGYLIDASALPAGIKRVHLEWKEPADGFFTRVRVEGSRNLEGWRELSSGVTIAHMRYGGETLTRRKISLNAEQGGYLRLTWTGSTAPFELTGINAELVSARPEPRRETLEIPGDPSAGNQFVFDLGGPIPVDRVSFSLPQKNTLVEVQIESSPAAEGPWRSRHQGRLYRVAFEDGELSTPAIGVRGDSDRYWRVRVDPKGGGLGGGAPMMHAAWLPQQLVFVARGEAPFVAAYGSFAAKRSEFDAASLIDLVPDASLETLALSTAQLGGQYTEGGDAALVPPPPPTPWKVWLLWAVLVLGVGLMGWMSLRLVRQLNASGSASPE